MELEACVDDDAADIVDGEDADELREDDLEACSLDMLGRVGLALSNCASWEIEFTLAAAAGSPSCASTSSAPGFSRSSRSPETFRSRKASYRSRYDSSLGGSCRR